MNGEILGYVHNFCNWRLLENKTEFACFAHSFFSFDMYFLIQGLQATTCNTKDFDIGRTGSSNINLTNINSKSKFVDTLKYYQETSSIHGDSNWWRKKAIKKITRQFLIRHSYFGPIWKKILPEQKKKVLEITSIGMEKE